MQDDEIIHVADIVLRLQVLLGKYIQLVQIEICAPLADQITDRQIMAVLIVDIAICKNNFLQ